MKEAKSSRILSRLKNETFSYLLFGILTTVVNYTIFVIGLSITGDKKVLLVNMVAFVGATLFAYITNKIFVFKSRNWTMKQVFLELGKFTSARVFSLLLEQAGLFIASDWMKLGDSYLFSLNCLIIAKVILSFVSVLLNYFASKFVVFKKEKVDESTDDCAGL